jgi:predicted transglutaminase-like cysteine proteinase
MPRPLHIGVLAALLLMVSPAANEPFGAATVPAAPGELSTIWHGLRLDMAADEMTVAACRANPVTCVTPAALELIGIVDEAKRYEGRARIAHINRAVNEAIASTRHDVPWMSPLAALTYPGDCKSYAVTKYAALGEAGIAPEDRRLIIVRDHLRPAETHLIAVVRLGSQWLILDDDTMTLVDSTNKPTYEPLHALDENGVREFPAAIPLG